MLLCVNEDGIVHVVRPVADPVLVDRCPFEETIFGAGRPIAVRELDRTDKRQVLCAFIRDSWHRSAKSLVIRQIVCKLMLACFATLENLLFGGSKCA